MELNLIWKTVKWNLVFSRMFCCVDVDVTTDALGYACVRDMTNRTVCIIEF